MTGAGLMTRRQLVLGACCLASAGAVAVSGSDEIAPGIFVRRGADEDAAVSNDDAIANIGFVVGREAVAVIDPGGSLRDGERLRARIRQVTALPIRYVIMTHLHPDHIFGAAAFQQDRPAFVGHSRLPQALAARGEYYRKRLADILGSDSAGTVVMPTQLVRDSTRLDLGGRALQLTAHGTAHSDCDLTVLELDTATLFAGDLLFVERIASLDGSLKGGLGELNSLKTVAARRAVPGHGPTSVNWPAGSLDLERYLGALLRETRQAVAKGVDIETAVGTVGQSERGRWKLFDAYHGHNVTQAFKEIEWE